MKPKCEVAGAVSPSLKHDNEHLLKTELGRYLTDLSHRVTGPRSSSLAYSFPEHLESSFRFFHFVIRFSFDGPVAWALQGWLNSRDAVVKLMGGIKI